MGNQTKPSDTTRAEEANEARSEHDAGRGPSKDEAAAAEKNKVDPKTREAYEKAVERGAKQQGEGKPGV